MAAAPKKKKTSQPAKKNTRTPPPPAPTYGRESAGGVCLLLALCAVVSYFQEEALFITFFGGLLKGLLGYGCYWTAEYKGQYVSMLTEEELAQAKTLVISHHEGLMEQDPEHAFTVPLSR